MSIAMGNSAAKLQLVLYRLSCMCQCDSAKLAMTSSDEQAMGTLMTALHIGQQQSNSVAREPTRSHSGRMQTYDSKRAHP